MEIITRADARERGLKRFFTGLLCDAGHLSERNVASGTCLACSRDKSKASRVDQREKISQQRRALYAANPEKYKDAQRRMRAEDPERSRSLARARRASNLDEYRARQRDYRDRNRSSVIARQREARNADRERFRNYDRAWNASNPIKLRAKVSKRRASERRAVPCWFGELDDLVWLEAADLACRRAMATGVAWNADHMIPLRSTSASGLHTWNNCQVIPAGINAGKKNRMILTNPLEWLFCL